MKRIFGILISCLLMVACNQTTPKELVAVNGLVERLLPGHGRDFLFEEIPTDNGKDVFELESKKGKIVIRGNNGVSMARGVNHYLRNYCHASASWCGDNLNLPAQLPSVEKRIRIVSPYEHRYFMNYCTVSYSTSFWDWERWEREIDLMALQGINLPLAIVGQEAVWQNTLRQFDFSEEEIRQFLCGPAYHAWWLMGNLEGWGGPVSQDWIDQQATLQKKIVNRMREYGMKPVLQGFYGMVPNKMKEKFPDSGVHLSGKWGTFIRPGFLEPGTPLFTKMASVYYNEQKKLYGETKYFAGDPFHEGGGVKGMDITKAAQDIYKAMNAVSEDTSVWVLQAWQANPSAALLKGLKKGQALVLDLNCESRPQWGGVPSVWKRKEGFLGHDWAWCCVPNFGGRIGLYGKLDLVAHDIPQVAKNPLGKEIKGIGAMPEGIGTYPVAYDLLFDMAWCSESPDMKKWINDYAVSRYGKSIEPVQRAWEVFRKTIYNCAREKYLDGPPESVLCARPDLTVKNVSTWGTAEIHYDPHQFNQGVALLFEGKDQLKESDTYQYDVVDATRQVLANYGFELLGQIKLAYELGDETAFKKRCNQFLEVIEDQDRLLVTRPEFLLGRWIESARALGKAPQEKDLLEWNARTQITVWGDRKASDVFGLHEYAHKEWAGMLQDFYYPRWKMYFKHLEAKMKGEESEKPDFFAWEEKWTRSKKIYPATPSQDDPVELAFSMFKKYSH